VAHAVVAWFAKAANSVHTHKNKWCALSRSRFASKGARAPPKGFIFHLANVSTFCSLLFCIVRSLIGRGLVLHRGHFPNLFLRAKWFLVQNDEGRKDLGSY
jgi:hypothetical protein